MCHTTTPTTPLSTPGVFPLGYYSLQGITLGAISEGIPLTSSFVLALLLLTGVGFLAGGAAMGFTFDAALLKDGKLELLSTKR